MNRKDKTENSVNKVHVWNQFQNSIRLLGSQKRRYMLLLLLETLLNGLSPAITLVITQQMINALQTMKQDFQPVLLYVIFLTTFTACIHVFQNSLNYWKEREEYLFEKNFHTRLLEKVSAMDCSDLENSDYYDLIDRTQYDANAGILGNIKNTFSFFTALLGTFSYIFILAEYHLFLLIIIILTPSVRYFYEKKYNILSYRMIRENTEHRRRMSYYFRMLIDADCAKEIRMYRLSKLFTERYAQLKEHCDRKSLDISRKRLHMLFALEIVEQIIDFFCVLYVAKECFIGNLLVGSFILYSNSIDSAKQSLWNLFYMRSVLYKYASMLEQIQSFLGLPEERCNQGGKSVGKIHTLEVRHLSYCYPNQTKKALQDVNFIMHEGELTVLMGYNGSGKSTLIKILMGIYHNYEGDILVNGINRRQLDLELYRKKISVVFQNYMKYETCIAENIWYGDILRELHTEEVSRMLKSSELEGFLEEQNTALGYQFCHGRQISIGEWQKLAVARGLYRKADFYIMDEPNASLDLFSEETVFRFIEKETKNQMCLLIMHRFNHFAKAADQILVLDSGRMAEHGRHQELMKIKGLYFRLYCAQNGPQT